MSQAANHKDLLKRAFVRIEELETALAERQRQSETLAVVGLGCRLPGGADDPDRFWQLLLDGFDATSEIPPDRWDVDAYYDPDPDARGRMYTRRGAFLSAPVDRFDAQFFGIAPKEADEMDPQQRLLLEVVWEALERGGHAPAALHGSATGVFVGMAARDWAHIQDRGTDTSYIGTYYGTGGSHSVAAGRIAYVLGLRGPAITIDTACSSSLVAFHEACLSLRSGETRMAIVAGISLMLAPNGHVIACSGRMLSPDGRCKTFDASADGYVRGEGCGVVLLKRLSDARADGDRILALVHGTAVNQDGRSAGLTAPNGRAQEDVIRAALRASSLSPADVGYLEAHGTGTELGDPIEIQALGAVHAGRPDPLLVGSVKTNIGHLEPAAGIAGLIKTVLALEHGVIPPHLHVQTPNPHIPWSELPIEVATAAVPWPRSGQRRRIAGVSSFGFSGTNAHVVLEEYAGPAEPQAGTDVPCVVTVSARSESALDALAARLAAHVAEQEDVAPHAVAATLATARNHFEHRAAAVVGNREELIAALRDIARGSGERLRGKAQTKRRPRVAFLFTGQGSQRPGMGRELLDSDAAFRDAIERCDAVLRPLLGRSIVELIRTAPDDEAAAAALRRTELTQPALFALEWALAQTWRSWGIEPAVVIGHSLGEYVAACVAGVLELEDALRLVAERGRLIGALPAGGSMAAVFASETDVRGLLGANPARLGIAALNGPANTVVSGDEEAVESLLREARARQIEVRPLAVSHAFHSPLMEPVLETFRRVAASVTYRPPEIDLISNVTAQKAAAATLDADYWVRHILEPVRFAPSVETLRAAGPHVLLEVGPAPVLLGLAAACGIPPQGELRVSSLRPGVSAALAMREALAQLYVAGVPIHWEKVAPGRLTPIALPTYPFQRERHWVALAPPRSARRRGEHPLLGAPLVSPRLTGTVFETELGENEPAWVDGHQVFGRPVLPAAAYLEMARAAVEAAHARRDLAVRAMEILEPLVLDVPRRVQTLVDDERVEIVSRAASESEWRTHFSGRLAARDDRAAEARAAESIVPGKGGEELDVTAYLERIRAAGVEYRGPFRALARIRREGRAAFGEIDTGAITGPELAQYAVHPALLDAAFQLCGACTDVPEGTVYLPVAVGELKVRGRVARGTRLDARATIVEADADAGRLVCDVEIEDRDAGFAAAVRGLVFRRAAQAPAQSEQKLLSSLYVVDWIDLSIPPPAVAAERWLVVGTGEDAESAAASLERRGRTVSTMPFDGLTEIPADAAGVVLVAPQVPQLPAEPAPGAVVAALRPLLEPLLDALKALPEGSAPRLCVLTRRGAAVHDGELVDPGASAVWGLGHTVAAEWPRAGCRLIDLDDGRAPEELADALLLAAREERLALRGGRWKAARLARYRKAGERLQRPSAGYRLEIARRGQLDQLTLESDRPAPPAPDEVAMRVHSTGLNFRDVLNALGMYPGDAGPLGSECAGVVEAVGSAVTGLQPGDRVMAITPRGFCSRVNVAAAMTVRVPDRLTFGEAATIPIAFLTADWALHELGKLQPGERVLIHAATGGVGMAAVQLARATGAEVFATAGSERKRAALRRLGIERVYDSRSLAFRDEILRDTAGEGVHVVLNSLADEFIAASFDVLRRSGRFIEIGKTGLWTAQQAAAVRPEGQYHVLYLGEACDREPLRVRRRFEALAERFARGELSPLPVRSFVLEETVEAFRFMAQARHMGKVVVFDSDDDAEAADSGAVWITGGLGGLGLEIAADLVRCGARRVALSGRSAPSAAAQARLESLRAAGADVRVIPCDTADYTSVREARAAIEAFGWTIQHVMHAAGVLDDATLRRQSWERFERVLAPKAAGAWHLHCATLDLPLQSFVLFSAGAGMLGSPGQAGYAAANTFLDGLAQLRFAQGLPALSVAWGPWAEVGMAARAGLDWTARGLGAIAPDTGAAALRRLRRGDATVAAVLPIDWRRLEPQGSEAAPFYAAFAVATEPRAATPAPSVPSATELSALEPAERHARIETYLKFTIAGVLGLRPEDVGPDTEITLLGFDSLMAVELRNRIERELGVLIPAGKLLATATPGEIAAQIAAQITGGAPAGDAASRQQVAAAVAAEEWVEGEI